jgi:phosphate transport system protein
MRAMGKKATAMPSPHTSRDLDVELRELRAHAIAMGTRCERGLGIAMEAFFSGSRTLAANVKQIDTQINSDQTDIDDLVLRTLILRQPVAYNLQLLTSALELTTDLGCAAGEAVKIAESGMEMDSAAKRHIATKLTAMAEHAQNMLRDALDAFVEGRSVRASNISQRDDEVDALHREIVRAITSYVREHPGEIMPALRVVKVAAYVESITDRARNIAKRVIPFTQGDDAPS